MGQKAAATIIRFSPEASARLKERDPVLGKFMDLAGDIRRTGVSDPFAGLIRSIMGQQISTAAHNSIWNNFLNVFPDPSPELIAGATDETMKSCGLSRGKAACIREVAKRFSNGEFANLGQLSDEEISERLTSVKGIGLWTVEMTLIFVFRRPDVLSFSDLAIRRGMRALYGIYELTREEFERRRKIYTPFGSLASLYLWEIASGKYAGYVDPAYASKKAGANKQA